MRQTIFNITMTGGLVFVAKRMTTVFITVHFGELSNPYGTLYRSPYITDITDELLEDALPHGSGIDCDWKFDRLKNGSILCHNSYHGMNESGMYDGWQDFTIKLFAHSKDVLNPLSGPSVGKTQIIHKKGDIDFSLHFNGYRQRKSWTYGLRDYLEDSIHYALSEAKILTSRYEIIDNPQLAKEQA